MHRQLISRFTSAARIGAVALAPGVAAPRIFYRTYASVPMSGSYIMSEAQQQEFKARDAATKARFEELRAQMEALPEEEKARLLEGRAEARRKHIEMLRAIPTHTRVPVTYAVDKYRAAVLSGLNLRGPAIKRLISAPWVHWFDGKRDLPDNTWSVSKERVDAANIRMLRFSQFLEVDLEGKWDGDLEADWPRLVKDTEATV